MKPALAGLIAGLALPAQAASPTDASVMARLGSCDPTVVRSAAQDVLRDPETLREPLTLLNAASAERSAGHPEEAAFLYLAGRLRTERQVLFERGDRPQLLAIMISVVGPQVMPVVEADPDLARRVVKRVTDWDRSTPDPFRTAPAARAPDIAKKIGSINAALAQLPDQILKDPARTSKAREMSAEIDRQIAAARAARCGPGTLDTVDAERATNRIKSEAEQLVRTHRLVLERAGGAVKSVNTGAWKQDPGGLPTRLTISVTPETGKTFFAEVDAEVKIAQHKLDALKVSLACLTELWIGQRDAFWKDVCNDDPKAIKSK